VAIDHIENVGSFVEFEISAPVEEWEGREVELRKMLINWLSVFNSAAWGKADKPYRDFVAERVKKSILKSGQTKAMLIDFDGTVVPSEKIFFRAFRDAVQAMYGYSLTIEEYKEHELSKSDGMFDYLTVVVGAKRGEKTGLMEKVYANYDAYSDSLLFDEEVMANLSALEKLKETGLRLALVTTSKRMFVEKILDHFGCRDLFETMVCREDVVHHKPDPEAFNLAMSKLGLSPNECVAVEDSRRGVTSAKSGQLTCIGVYNLSLTSREELSSMGVPVYESLMELVNILRFA
jgi:putative hydrolase of the HAD superfamily